ncbi:hypothetical protein SFC43_17160 [Bacteroides sp. CR5/BHMF/2]|nr:hypothetical protein [Bacteroides sp. CR5/BHMF/2]
MYSVCRRHDALLYDDFLLFYARFVLLPLYPFSYLPLLAVGFRAQPCSDLRGIIFPQGIRQFQSCQCRLRRE